MSKINLDVSITNDIYNTFSRYDYTISSAIAEFIDNSTASILNNIDYYLQNKIKPFVFIVFNREEKTIEIFDNGHGINQYNRERVFKLDIPPINTNGRNEFGMGLKNAAFWCGKKIVIKTKSFEEDEYYHLNFDISNTKNDSLAYLENISRDEWLKEFSKYNIDDNKSFEFSHGTYLKIDTSNQTIKTQSIKKTVRDVSAYYNEDIDSIDKKEFNDNDYKKITIKIAEFKNGRFYDLSYYQTLNNDVKYKRQISKFYNDCYIKFNSFPEDKQQEISNKVDPILNKIIDLKDKEDSYSALAKQYERLTEKWSLFDNKEKYDVTDIGNTSNYNNLKQLVSYKPQFSKLEDFKKEIENKNIDVSVYVDKQFKVLLDFDFDDLNGNIYHANGFIGLLSPDFTGRDKAGIKLYRRGRLIREGDNDFYKPKDIFKDAGSFEYQRIYGEINVDNLPCSQSKTKLKWDEDTKLNFNKEILKVIDKPISQMVKIPYKEKNHNNEYKYNNKEKIKDNIRFLLNEKQIEVSTISIDDEDNKVLRIDINKDNVSNYYFIYEIKHFNDDSRWIDIELVSQEKINKKFIENIQINEKDEFFIIQLDNSSPWINPLNDNENAIDKIIELLTFILTKTIIFTNSMQYLTESRNLIQDLVDTLNEKGISYEIITNKK